jgi:hypothetical protein
MQASLEIRHCTKKTLHKSIVTTLEEVNTPKAKEAGYAHLEVMTLPYEVFEERIFNEEENVNRLASAELSRPCRKLGRPTRFLENFAAEVSASADGRSSR